MFATVVYEQFAHLLAERLGDGVAAVVRGLEEMGLTKLGEHKATLQTFHPLTRCW
jgi:hypothetical protein